MSFANTREHNESKQDECNFTAAIIPVPIQNAIGKLGMMAIFANGLVTLRATKSRLNVKIASIIIAFPGIIPAPGLIACTTVTSL